MALNTLRNRVMLNIVVSRVVIAIISNILFDRAPFLESSTSDEGTRGKHAVHDAMWMLLASIIYAMDDNALQNNLHSLEYLFVLALGSVFLRIGCLAHMTFPVPFLLYTWILDRVLPHRVIAGVTYMAVMYYTFYDSCRNWVVVRRLAYAAVGILIGRATFVTLERIDRASERSKKVVGPGRTAGRHG